MFVKTRSEGEQWILLKYENLLVFCFGYGCLGHGLKDCDVSSQAIKESFEDVPLYSVALKAESSLVGKKCRKYGFDIKKSMK